MGIPTPIEMKYYRVLGITMPSTATGVTFSIAVAFVSCVCISIWRLLNPVSKKKKLSLDFSEVKPLHGFDLVNTPPYPWRPWRVGKFQMTMGLRKMPEDDWLILDNLYKEEQAFRTHLLESNRNGVMQVLPVAEEACAETLEYIVEFLIRRFPTLFQRPSGKPECIHNLVTNKIFKVTAPYDEHPLAVAAQLVMEDINLLMQGTGEDPKEYYLCASYSMGPAGWYINERIGWPLHRIHHPVPMWQEKLRKAMEKFFLTLQISKPVQRNNYFMQANDTMFQQEPFPSSMSPPPRVEDIRIRHERQTLRRLPRSNAVLFMVRTFLLPVVDLVNEKDNLYAFREAVNAWPEEMATYKAKQVWEAPFEEWYGKVMKDYVPPPENEKGERYST